MKAEPLSQRSSGYIPTLDGWRALAVLAVILFHARVYRFHFLSTAPIAHYGRFAVQLFFGISGLLICSRLLEEEKLTGKLNLRSFYIRRTLRIQPPALFMLWVTAVLMAMNVVEPGWSCIVASVTLVRNYLPLHPDKIANALTGHFWSLSVEEHFYLLLPAFLVLCKRFRGRILLAATAVDLAWSIAAHFLFHDGEWALHATDRCLCYLTLPAGIAILLRRPSVRMAMTRLLQPWPVVIICAALLAWVKVGNPVSVLAPTALLLSTVLHPSSPISRLLETAPLRFVGRISFSLYLWQQLFFTGRYLDVRPLGALGSEPWNFLLTAALAVASYYLIEKPCMRLGHRLARPALEGRPGLAARVPSRAAAPMLTPSLGRSRSRRLPVYPPSTVWTPRPDPIRTLLHAESARQNRAEEAERPSIGEAPLRAPRWIDPGAN